MAKENSIQFEAGIPLVAKAKYKRTGPSTKKIFRYSCAINFASLVAAQEFREIVEKAVSEKNGEIHASNIETDEITKN